MPNFKQICFDTQNVSMKQPYFGEIRYIEERAKKNIPVCVQTLGSFCGS